MNTHDHLLAMGACSDACQWAEKFDNWSDIITNCNRPDWLLWLDWKMSILDDKERRLLACYFVRSTPLADGRKVWDLLTNERSRNAVLVAERYANGRATREELDVAGDAAWDAARDAWAAERAAAWAAWDAARAAGAAARDAWDAAGDAARAAGYAARDAALAHQAKYIRKKYGKRIIATLNEKHPLSK